MYSIHYTLRQKTNVKRNFLQTNYTVQKCLLFFCELQLITVLLLICDSSMSWSTRFVSLNLCVAFSIFNSVWFLWKFIFLFNKMYGYFLWLQNFIIPFIIPFAPRTLIFKLQQEVLKFNGICVNWSSRKTDLVTNFLNFENRNFDNASFSQ